MSSYIWLFSLKMDEPFYANKNNVTHSSVWYILRVTYKLPIAETYKIMIHMVQHTRDSWYVRSVYTRIKHVRFITQNPVHTRLIIHETQYTRDPLHMSLKTRVVHDTLDSWCTRNTKFRILVHEIHVKTWLWDYSITGPLYRWDYSITGPLYRWDYSIYGVTLSMGHAITEITLNTGVTLTLGLLYHWTTAPLYHWTTQTLGLL